MQSYLCDVQFCAKIELRFATTTVPFLMLFRGKGLHYELKRGKKSPFWQDNALFASCLKG